MSEFARSMESFATQLQLHVATAHVDGKPLGYTVVSDGELAVVVDTRDEGPQAGSRMMRFIAALEPSGGHFIVLTRFDLASLTPAVAEVLRLTPRTPTLPTDTLTETLQ